MVIIDRAGAQHLLGDLGIERRHPGAEHASQAVIGVKPVRAVVAKLGGKDETIGIDVCHRNRNTVTGVVDQVHRAPVDQIRNGQLGDVAQCPLVVERRCQHLASAGQERRVALGALALGHVLDDHDRRLDLAVGPSRGAALSRFQRSTPLDDADQQRLGRPAAEDAHRGNVIHRELLAGVTEHAIRREDLVGGRGPQLTLDAKPRCVSASGLALVSWWSRSRMVTGSLSPPGTRCRRRAAPSSRRAGPSSSPVPVARTRAVPAR